jgi:hypothetical protein
LILEKKAEKHWFDWRLPLYLAAGALVVFLPLAIYGYDFGSILYLFVVVPICSLVLLGVGIAFAIDKEPRRALAIVYALFVFWAVSWVLLRNELTMRSEVRWLWNSKTYKAQVLAQPGPANGDLRHIEWDGWGFAGNDTVVYLVFDPTDSLATAATRHGSGKFKGIPCEVPEVRHLEKSWYTVLFYTGLGWDGCR